MRLFLRNELQIIVANERDNEKDSLVQVHVIGRKVKRIRIIRDDCDYEGDKLNQATKDLGKITFPRNNFKSNLRNC